MLTAGSTESECVWSTTSCNVYVAILKGFRTDIGQILGKFSRALVDIRDNFQFYILDLQSAYSYGGFTRVAKFCIGSFMEEFFSIVQYSIQYFKKLMYYFIRRLKKIKTFYES